MTRNGKKGRSDDHTSAEEPSSLTMLSGRWQRRQVAHMTLSNEVLTVSEVAADLRCSKAHVYNIINGKVTGVSPLPTIALGRRRLIRRSTLEAWKRENNGLRVSLL